MIAPRPPAADGLVLRRLPDIESAGRRAHVTMLAFCAAGIVAICGITLPLEIAMHSLVLLWLVVAAVYVCSMSLVIWQKCACTGSSATCGD